jgi:hypothetical protein
VRVFAGLPVPRCVFLSHKPSWLVSEPIGRPGKNGAPFVPDNLLVMQEAYPQQAVQNFARELRRMPNVANLQAGHQCERFRPIGARVRGNGRVPVAFGPLLHVARFGRAMFVDTCSIAPLRIELDTVRRISGEQQRCGLAQQPRNVVRAGRITAQQPVGSEEPQVTQARCGNVRKRGSNLRPLFIERIAE